MKPSFRVVAAVAIRDGRVLVARRPEGGDFAGLWEFPGGKVEPGESDEDAIRREIREELGSEVTVGRTVAHHTFEYDDRVVDLHFLTVRLSGSEPTALHPEEIRWVTLEESRQIEFLDGDAAFLEQLRRPGVLEEWEL